MKIPNSKFQIPNSKFKVFLLILILFIGAFFRLYRIREYMTFLGDEGRDMLVVKRMLVDHRLTLLGPITSVGSMHMGPIYYYLMAPFLFLWNFDPVGPAVLVALLSVATILLVYTISAEFFHPHVGLLASFFYAISPLTIFHGRSSWNPNVVPFFATLLMYALLKVVVKKEYPWLAVIGLSLGTLIQLHYVTLMFIPILILTFLLGRFRLRLKDCLLAVFSFILAYSPFLLFEIRHDFVNTRSVLRFIEEQKGVADVPLISHLLNTFSDVLVRLFWRLLVIENAEFTKLFIAILMFVAVLSRLKIKKKKITHSPLAVIFIWLTVGILSFGIYRGVVYDYYFGSLFAIPFILAGLLLYTLWRCSTVGKIISIIIFFFLTFFNLRGSPLLIPPSNLVKNTEVISQFVFEKSEGKPYNFALIALKNSDHAYRYFLELWGRTPEVIENEVIDPERKTVTSQLFVVCEDKICQPLGHPLWEIAGFGMAKISKEWQISTVKVFKLEHL